MKELLPSYRCGNWYSSFVLRAGMEPHFRLFTFAEANYAKGGQELWQRDVRKAAGFIPVQKVADRSYEMAVPLTNMHESRTFSQDYTTLIDSFRFRCSNRDRVPGDLLAFSRASIEISDHVEVSSTLMDLVDGPMTFNPQLLPVGARQAFCVTIDLYEPALPAIRTGLPNVIFTALVSGTVGGKRLP